ncbi:MAG: cytochrome c-type biogenesis CcmF C-terminal domain-containing protein, partial [Limnobacter sp.]|nr:cytochrome c-type biogenesis CcmF C-terminal domain-containing protein [Limnobacter sp.]
GSGNGAWGVRLYYKPWINLIWWGCTLMAIGGFLTVFDRRYRSKSKEA